MKVVRFVFVSILTLSLVFVLNTKFGKIPPLGKMLDPFGGFWQNSQSSDINFPSTLLFAELKNEVKVDYDARLVPHISASNDYDLYFAQGYITAQSRLWQMEMQTHAAAGRLSEILGEVTLEYDRGQRRKGMVYGAENTLKAVNQDSVSKKIFRAYSDGINKYIASLQYRSFPLEYKLLDYKPETWTPLKTCLLLKYMADDLSGWDADLEYTNALSLFGRSNFDLLYPDNSLHGEETIIPKGTPWDFEPVLSDSIKSLPVKQPLIRIKRKKPDPENGSNNWAVSGTRTQSGNTILVNDPHLGLNLPSIFYETQLTSPGLNVYGVTLPGAPGILIGFNDSIAWGMTNARMDLKDWYKINFKNERKKDYFYDGQWLEAKKVVEEIKVRGQKPYLDTVLYTIHGPIMYDNSFNKSLGKQYYAVKWMGHEPSNEFLTLYKLNRAKSYADYETAVKMWKCPAQNFAFASAKGDVAIWVAGKFPIKWKDQGKFLMDGSKKSHTWSNFIPSEHNPHIVNPARGYISSANQHPVDSTYPYYVFDANYEYYRNRRINTRLNQMKDIQVEDMMRLQTDNFNLQASEALPDMIAGLDSTSLSLEEKEYLKMTQQWDYYNYEDQKGATVYEAWFNSFYAMVWDEMNTDSIPLEYPTEFNTIRLMKYNPQNQFFDIKSTPATETARDITIKSFKEAVKNLGEWQQQNSGKEITWANYKNTTILHLLRLDPLSVSNIATGGNEDAVNAMRKRHGPSWRMIVEMGNPIKAFGVYPGGQSGNPGSPYYSNFIDQWAEGRYFELVFLNPREDQKDKIVYSQYFKNK